MKYMLPQTPYMLAHVDSYTDISQESTIHIHNLSLEVAELFNEAFHTEGASEDMSVLLEVFRALRRELPREPDGKRYGATEAYETMRRKKGTTYGV